MTPADDAAAQWAALLSALEVECGVCSGTGRVLSVAWREWYERTGELIRVAQVARRAAGVKSEHRITEPPEAHDGSPIAAAEVPLVVAAAERAMSEHEAARPREPERAACANCRGRGALLTPVGERVAGLLTRHGFVRDE